MENPSIVTEMSKMDVDNELEDEAAT